MPIESPHPWVDTSNYPIVIVAFPSESTANDVQQLANAMRRFASTVREPIAIVTDLTLLRTGDPEARETYAGFVRDVRPTAGRWTRGTAVIIQSTLQRALFNVHTLLVGSTPYPVRAFGQREHALPWLQALLARETASCQT